MTAWVLVSTDTFSSAIKKFKKNGQLLLELDKKLKKLKTFPEIVGSNLAGNLHGYKSTRLGGKYRLVFKIDSDAQKVILFGLDHRKADYERFR